MSWLLNPHHPYFFFVVFLALCVFSLRVHLDTLGYASDFKNSKKSVSPYVSGFQFRFPPYGPLFGRSVLLQYLHHLFTLFVLIAHHGDLATASCTSQSLLYRPLQFIIACIVCSQALRLFSSSTHIIRAYQVLVKWFFIEHLFYFIYEWLFICLLVVDMCSVICLYSLSTSLYRPLQLLYSI